MNEIVLNNRRNGMAVLLLSVAFELAAIAALIAGGVRESAALCTAEALTWPLAPGEQAQVRIHAPQYAFAPVLRGPAGYAELLVDGIPVRRTALYYRNPVARTPPEKRGLARIFGG